MNNPFVKVTHSKVHGRGVYSALAVKKGTPIIEYIGERITKAESDKRADKVLKRSQATGGGSVYIFTLNNKMDIDGDVPWNTARLINHSCEPNCETDIEDDHIWIIAKRDIKKGEELNYDYGYDMANWEEHPCRCGTKSCVGFIVGKEHRAKLKKLKAYQKLNK